MTGVNVLNRQGVFLPLRKSNERIEEEIGICKFLSLFRERWSKTGEDAMSCWCHCVRCFSVAHVAVKLTTQRKVAGFAVPFAVFAVVKVLTAGCGLSVDKNATSNQ